MLHFHNSWLPQSVQAFTRVPCRCSCCMRNFVPRPHTGMDRIIAPKSGEFPSDQERSLKDSAMFPSYFESSSHRSVFLQWSALFQRRKTSLLPVEVWLIAYRSTCDWSHGAQLESRHRQPRRSTFVRHCHGTGRGGRRRRGNKLRQVETGRKNSFCVSHGSRLRIVLCRSQELLWSKLRLQLIFCQELKLLSCLHVKALHSTILIKYHIPRNDYNNLVYG